MKPADPEPKTGHAEFTNLVRDALVDLTTVRKTFVHAFDLGIRAPELFRYAVGRHDAPEEFAHLLAHSPWAVDRVCAIVKAMRNPEFNPVLIFNGSNQDELEALRVLEQF